MTVLAFRSSDDERLAIRQQYAIPVLDDIFAWCREHCNKYLPKDPLSGAIHYALNHEVALRRYCDDGRLEIDNNAAERVLRLIAIGGKNWLFYGSERGGRTGAVLHSILARTKRSGLNEFVYLCDYWTSWRTWPASRSCTICCRINGDRRLDDESLCRNSNMQDMGIVVLTIDRFNCP